MTTEQMQEIADRTLRTVALRYGSTTKRDFYVIVTVLDAVLGSVSVPLSEASGRNGAGAQRKDHTLEVVPQEDEQA